MRVLLLCSQGRSGSSWIARLLTSLPKSVYIFEPFHDYHGENKIIQTVNDEDVPKKWLKDIFYCNNSIEFIKNFWHEGKIRFLDNNDYIGKFCKDRNASCFTKLAFDDACKQSELMLIKVLHNM